MFEAVEEETAEKILARLMDETGIELKTDIPNVTRLAALNMLADALELEGCPESSKLVNSYIKLYLKYQVSSKRQGRKEIVSAVAAITEQKRTFGEKIRGPPV